MNVIPFKKFPFWSEDVKIGTGVFRFRFMWNGRFKYWSMSILNTSDQSIVDGIKIVLSIDLLSNYKYNDKLPTGKIIPIRVNNTSFDRVEKGDLEDQKVLLSYWGE